jgi:hypothetical protein
MGGYMLFGGGKNRGGAPAPAGNGGPPEEPSGMGDEVGATAAFLRDLAGELFGQTRPLRTTTIDTLLRVLQGERPENFRVFAPEREALEGQFRNAQANTIAQTPTRGGQLYANLNALEAQRALGVASQESDVRRNAFAQALSVGFGTPSVAFGGLGAAGNLFGTQGELQGQSSQRALSTLALLGQLLGGSSSFYGGQSQAKKSNLTSIAGAYAGGKPSGGGGGAVETPYSLAWSPYGSVGGGLGSF